MWVTAGAYTPSAIELVVSLGIVSLAVLLYLLIAPKLFGEKSTVSDASASEAEATSASEEVLA
jgi:Ni/Fe-hydrogenase subunit HybB-like protein